MDRYAVLKRYFGHDAFRPGQETMINALLSGADAFGVMPTGAGKSMCYQIPALLLPGLTLVISPLISLMKDQVSALEQAGVPAACLNSAMDFEQGREVYRRAAVFFVYLGAKGCTEVFTAKHYNVTHTELQLKVLAYLQCTLFVNTLELRKPFRMVGKHVKAFFTILFHYPHSCNGAQPLYVSRG